MYNKVVVFEGVDGSGKSFHLNAASNYLKKKKIKHIKLREPGAVSYTHLTLPTICSV